MDSTALIERMMVHPDPVGWYNTQRRREQLRPIYQIDNPAIVTTRPYGIARGIGAVTKPVDYTMGRFGGTLRGAQIGSSFRDLRVSGFQGGYYPDSTPDIITYRGSSQLRKHGQSWMSPNQKRASIDY